MKEPDPAAEFAFKTLGKKVFSVSEITRRVRELIENNFPSVWIEGEISNFKQIMSGHVYFTLKDELSQIKAVMFRTLAQKIDFQPGDGMMVIALGRLSVYEPKGEYQIIIDFLQPKGVGALQLKFEQLKKKLEAEGLFDPSRKRKIPFMPTCIGIVTSPTGAAIRDILMILERRFPNLHIIIYPVRVQGEGAAQEIAEGIEYLNKMDAIDVLISGRGGGSLEDLWAFNEESVARAIFNSRIPVISAVGHEIDFTIADFVADLRAPTPSAAAELVVKNREDLRLRVKELSRRFNIAYANHLQNLHSRIELLTHRLLDPRKRIEELKEGLDDISERILNGIKRTVELKKTMISAKADNLNALNPLAVLERGYSITFMESTGEVLKYADRTTVGDGVRVRLKQGEIGCTVREIKS